MTICNVTKVVFKETIIGDMNTGVSKVQSAQEFDSKRSNFHQVDDVANYRLRTRYVFLLPKRGRSSKIYNFYKIIF